MGREDIPFERRGNLTSQEKEAIGLIQEYGLALNDFLRDPGIVSEGDWIYYSRIVKLLDLAISKSFLARNKDLYRGFEGDFCDRVLFCMSIDPDSLEVEHNYEALPHIIQDRAYTSFSADLDCALDFTESDVDYHLVFTIKGRRNDNALYLGGTDEEYIFPRKIPWVTTGYSLRIWEECRIIFISLDKYIEK